MAETSNLTDAKIRALRSPAQGQVELRDTLVPGLRLRLGKTGARTFILRKRVGMKVHNVTLGRYHERTFTLAQARKNARAMLSDLEGGKLPPKRQERKPDGTIAAMVEQYLLDRSHLRSIREIERIFSRYILPEVGHRLAASLDRGEVTALINKVGRPTMGRAVAAQLSAFYGWAMPYLPALASNPCRDAGRPDKAPSRDRVLADWELALLWQAAGEGGRFGTGVRLLILTLQRRAEVFEARKSEFDRRRMLWTIPAARAKNGVANVVPITAKIGRELAALGAFTGEGPLMPAQGEETRHECMTGYSKAWARIRRRVDQLAAEQGIPPLQHFTMHDLRRTGATGLQRLGVALQVTEALLNHRSGTLSGIVGVYQRHQFADEKRGALVQWGRHVAQLTRPFRT